MSSVEQQNSVERESVLEPEKSRLPRVSLILLNWNSYEVTADCLLSIRKLGYPNFEVVLVDNGSHDSSIEDLENKFPEVRFIRNKNNLGFTGGNNVGIRDALERGADYLLLLNNDTVVAPDFLAEMVRVAESDSKIGILNPKIYFFEPSDRLWYGGGILKPWWSFPKHLGLHKLDGAKYSQTREVSFITGCAFMIRAEVVRRIGLLDETFFYSFEDADWSLRALKAGFKAVYVAPAVIWHKDSYVTMKNAGKDLKDFYHTRNSILLARKHLPGKYWPLFLLSFGRWLGYRTAGYLVRREPHRVRALYKGIWSGCRTRMQQSALSNQPSAPKPKSG